MFRLFDSNPTQKTSEKSCLLSFMRTNFSAALTTAVGLDELLEMLLYMICKLLTVYLLF